MTVMVCAKHHFQTIFGLFGAWTVQYACIVDQYVQMANSVSLVKVELFYTRKVRQITFYDVRMDF